MTKPRKSVASPVANEATMRIVALIPFMANIMENGWGDDSLRILS